jgi:L-fuculose-phosphate aldolase
MLTAMCDVMKEAYRRGWITTRDGNVSVRKSNANRIYLTPAGVRKNVVNVEMLVRMDIGEEVKFSSKLNLEPTGEWDMHYRILKDATTTKSVVHIHPTNIIAAMHAGWDLHDMVKPFPEVFRYTRVGHNVPFIPPLSRELAMETKAQLGIENNVRRYDIVGQVSHGVTAVGDNPWDAFEHIERVEHIAKIVLASGVKPDLIDTDKKWWNVRGL